jgi:hypothetical protein
VEVEMPKKLTLYLKSETIKKAKLIAARNKSSVSGMIERFIDDIPSDDLAEHFEMTPIVKQLAGIISHVKDPEHEKMAYLTRKYA